MIINNRALDRILLKIETEKIARWKPSQKPKSYWYWEVRGNVVVIASF